MSRWLVPAIGFVLALVFATAADATPRLCVAADSGGDSSGPNAPDPRGTTVNFVYAKIDGVWTEPHDVCVAVRFHDSEPHNRYVAFSLWYTAGFYLNLTDAGLPAGTPIAIGLHLPDGAKPVAVQGQWRNGIAAFGDSDFAAEAQTAPWEYVASAYNSDQTAASGTIDCSQAGPTFASTYGGFLRVESVAPDGSLLHEFAALQGAFFESNASVWSFPEPIFDDDNLVRAVSFSVAGCGDHDPKTLEGHLFGFIGLPALAYIGLTPDKLMQGSDLIPGLMQVRDGLTGKREKFSFHVISQGDLAFDPIPGVTFPPLPSGDGPVGILGGSDFSYSKHDLLVETRKANVATFDACRTAGGTVTGAGATIKCRPDPNKPNVTLRTPPRATSSGLEHVGLRVACDEPFAVKVTLARVADGRRIGSGRVHLHSAGAVRVRVKVGGTTRRLLAATRGAIAAKLRFVVTDGSGSARILVRRVTLTK